MKSRKICLVAYCILDQNSRARGVEISPSGLLNGIRSLMDRGWGVRQLPCPELIYGVDRDPKPMEHYCSPEFIEHCSELAGKVIDELKPYLDQGIELEAILGMDGSPSCGINYVHGIHGKFPGMGIFIQKLIQKLGSLGISPELISYQQLIEK